MKNDDSAKITHSRLMEVAEYNPETGIFHRTATLSSRAKKGEALGSPHSAGYLECRIDGVRYYLHRLAWFYIHGAWPTGEIDHINRDKLDNRIANLRDATHQVNNINKGLMANNTSGHSGVYYQKRSKSFRAQIMINRKMISLGGFKTKEEAVKARLSAEEKYFRKLLEVDHG